MASPIGSISLPPSNDTFLKIFLKHQLRPNPKPPLESNSVAHQTAVITGGNTGIGLECGRLLLSLQLSHLVLAVRSLTNGEQAAALLRKVYPEATIDVWHLDLNSYESVRAFARKCETLPRLDIAILSAGIMNIAFKVNLSTALLALLLLPTLKRKNPSGTPGRLTMVASGAALIAEFSERNAVPLIPSFDKQDGWNASVAKKRYDTSKAMVLMLAFKLSNITKAENTVINVVDPTFTPGTGFFRNLPFLMKLFAWPLATLLGTSVNKAAWTYIDAAVARGEESHGSFLSDWEIHSFHAFMYTEQGNMFMSRLWNETLTELDFPEVRHVLESLHEEPTV